MATSKSDLILYVREYMRAATDTELLALNKDVVHAINERNRKKAVKALESINVRDRVTFTLRNGERVYAIVDKINQKTVNVTEDLPESKKAKTAPETTHPFAGMLGRPYEYNRARQWKVSASLLTLAPK